MAETTFFDTPTEASVKKHTIVRKYFGGWATIILPSALKREGAIKYVDLFCGPGRYRDGTPATPLLVLQHAINTPALHDTLHTTFNDQNPVYLETLKRAVTALPGIELRRHPPKFRNVTIGRETIPHLAGSAIPTLYFADPFGYHGISIDLIHAALTKWGSDMLFFFNYNRINMNLNNEQREDAIDEFFTPARARALRERLTRLRPLQREQAILQELRASIKNLKAMVEVFTYRTEHGRTSHHLACASRSKDGIALFKEISARESSRIDDYIPSGDHTPNPSGQQSLFSPMATLEEELVTTYEGKTLTFDDLYHQHHPGTPYNRKSLHQAVQRLEETGAVIVETTPDTKRKPGTIPTTANLRFSKVS